MNNIPPGQVPAPPPSETKRPTVKNGLIVAFLVVLGLLAAALISEIIYLSRNPEEKCQLFSCQAPETITSTITSPAPLNQDKVERMKTLLNRLTSDRQGVQLFSEFKFYSVSQGVVIKNLPEVLEQDGIKFVYFLVIQDQNQNTLNYRFTQEELDLMEAKIVGPDGTTYEATVNDLTIGDFIVLKIIRDFLDTSDTDKLILEISRVNP